MHPHGQCSRTLGKQAGRAARREAVAGGTTDEKTGAAPTITITAAKATAPITMPAIAPPERAILLQAAGHGLLAPSSVQAAAAAASGAGRQQRRRGWLLAAGAHLAGRSPSGWLARSSTAAVSSCKRGFAKELAEAASKCPRSQEKYAREELATRRWLVMRPPACGCTHRRAAAQRTPPAPPPSLAFHTPDPQLFAAACNLPCSLLIRKHYKRCRAFRGLSSARLQRTAAAPQQIGCYSGGQS